MTDEITLRGTKRDSLLIASGVYSSLTHALIEARAAKQNAIDLVDNLEHVIRDIDSAREVHQASIPPEPTGLGD